MAETTYRKGRRCANCDTPVGDRGPNSRSGEYYCPAPECRAIRDARRQSRYREVGVTWKDVARRVEREIEVERERDRPLVEQLLESGMTRLQVRQRFPQLRL